MRRAPVVLLSALLLTAVAAPAAAEPPPAPTTTPNLTRLDGPWPPRSVLAADPATVDAPATTLAAPGCPAAPYGVFSAAPGTGRTVALTFDDGPGATTARILDILQREGVPATFFNIGVNESVRPTWVRTMQTAGYALGGHTWSHPEMPTLSASAQAAEFDRQRSQQASLVGRPPCLFRPPYGAYDATTLSLAQARGMTVWNWNVDTEDWRSGTSTDPAEAQRVLTRAQAGGSLQHPVILMHNPPAGIPATVSALPGIIRFYRDRGYTFVDLHGRVGQRPAPAVARTDAGEQVTARGGDGALLQRTGSGGGWTAFGSLGGDFHGGPATIAQTSALTSSFVTGPDNAVWQRTRPDTGGGTWTTVGGTATSRPAAATTAGIVSVAIRGGNGGVHLKTYRPGAGWGGWQALGGALTSAPAMAFTADGRLTVVGVGTDRALWLRQRTGSTWGGWRRVGGATDAEPALTASADGSRLVAAVRGTDGAIWTAVAGSASLAWSPWSSRGGVLASGPGIARSGTGLTLVAYGTNGAVYRNAATGGATATGWTGWVRLPAGASAPTG